MCDVVHITRKTQIQTPTRSRTLSSSTQIQTSTRSRTLARIQTHSMRMRARRKYLKKRANLIKECALSCQIEMLPLAALPAAITSLQQLQQCCTGRPPKPDSSRSTRWTHSFLFLVRCGPRPTQGATETSRLPRVAVRLDSRHCVWSARGFGQVDDVWLTGPRADATRRCHKAMWLVAQCFLQ
jgi:hypothetical protein